MALAGSGNGELASIRNSVLRMQAGISVGDGRKEKPRVGGAEY